MQTRYTKGGVVKRILAVAAAIAAAGVLALPNRSLAASNLIQNNSFETATNNIAPSWTGSGWGTNSWTATVQNTGAQDGANLASVTMSNRTDGDVKWRFDPIVVTPGQTYTFSVWYQSDVATELDAEVLTTSGTTQYLWLASVPASTTWKQLNINFTAPANASKVSLMQILFSNGYLKTDNYSFTGYVAPPPVTPGSSILNPSMESGDAVNITNWTTAYWGSLTPTFSIKNEGKTGTRSSYVSVANYVDGDAKWVFDPIAVKPSTTYTFKDAYKSNVASNVVVAITKTDGTISYINLGNAPASATNWATFTKDFAVPSDAKLATVFHALAANGWLQTDDYSLAEYVAPTPPAAGTNLVLNQSMESGNSTAITNWTKSSWGSQTVTHTVKTTGAQSGKRSAYVQVSNHVTGDAKWMFDPVSIVPGKTYVYSDWYKASVPTEVDAIFTMQDGTQQVQFLGSGWQDKTTWTQFKRSFVAPANVKSVTITHILYQNGWLQLDNVSLAEQAPTPPAQAGQPFSRPMVSLEFDDGWLGAYQYGLPVFESFGYKPTQYIITGSVDQPEYMSKAQVIDWSNRAYIGSHTVSHPELPTLTKTQITNQLTNSKNYLQNLTGKPVNLFVTPYCEANGTVTTVAKTLYKSLRNCDSPVNTAANFDRYNLQSFIVLSTTTDAELLSYINQAKATNGWLILVWHEVTPGTPIDKYGINQEVLRHQLQLVKDSGIYVTNTEAALNEALGQ